MEMTDLSRVLKLKIQKGNKHEKFRDATMEFQHWECNGKCKKANLGPIISLSKF